MNLIRFENMEIPEDIISQCVFELVDSESGFYEEEMGCFGMICRNGVFETTHGLDPRGNSGGWVRFDDEDVDEYSEYAEDNGSVVIFSLDLRVIEHPPINNESAPLEKQKEIATKIVQKLRLVDKNACLAGGAAAAFYREEQANDLDFFVALPSYYSREDAREALNTLTELSLVDMGRDYGVGQTSSQNGFLHVFRTFTEEGQELQFIVTPNNPVDALKTFPYSHTQVCWTGERFFTHSQFDLFVNFGIVVKNYEPAQRYKEKCEALFKEKGYTVADNAEHALELSMEMMVGGKKSGK